MTPEQQAKAQQLADLMNELGACIWNNVIHLDNDTTGARVALRMEDHGDSVLWKFRQGITN